MPSHRRLLGWAVIAVVGAIVLFFPSYAASLPSYQLIPAVQDMVPVLAFMIMALGLNIVVGYAGLLDLGFVAFYAAGSYVAGWFASSQFAGSYKHPRSIIFGAADTAKGSIGVHISPFLLVLAGCVFAAALGVVIGLPTLRLRGDYLAIVTLGFGEIIPVVVRNGDNFGGYNVTNGSFGLAGIDPMGFGHTIHGWFAFLPVDFASQFNPDKFYYWTCVALLALALFASIRVRDSRIGRAWVAIREDEDAAGAMGIPLMRTKTLAYAMGAFFGGGAGTFLAFYNGGANPTQFYLNISIFILCMVVLGGMGNVWGVCLGALVLGYLNYHGLAAIGNVFNGEFNTNFQIPQYEFGIYGLLIVLIMLFRPEGLFPSTRRRAELEYEEEADAVAEGAA